MAVIMLLAVVTSNLLLENFVEPRVMGPALDIHPLVVLAVTALGGIIRLILAIAATVIGAHGISRLRSGGVNQQVTDRAQPTPQHMLDGRRQFHV